MYVINYLYKAMYETNRMCLYYLCCLGDFFLKLNIDLARTYHGNVLFTLKLSFGSEIYIKHE